MKNLTKVMLLTLVTCSLGALSSVDPNNYIWLNYTEKNPIKLLYDNTYGATIPCYARIGQCRISYTLIPPGWKVATDSSLLVPKSDINKASGFALKATLSELTGEKINADLVMTFQNGLISVQDRNQFLNANSYDPKAPSYSTGSDN